MNSKATGIKFKNNPKIYDFLQNEEEPIEIGDFVLVDTAFGTESGQVIYIDKKITKDNKPTQKVIRKINSEEIAQQKEAEKDKNKAEEIFKKAINRYNLEMKLVDIEFTFDNKVVFLFTAENRVDFRDLVKELIKNLKKQVRLKQIGPRDEARYLGGFGQCGKPVCCREFLGTIESVTMDMARDQNMASKGSTKISGVCGRLMCCLAYEDKQYKEILKNLPKLGEKIKTNEGLGEITFIDPISKKAEIRYSDGSRGEVNL